MLQASSSGVSSFTGLRPAHGVCSPGQSVCDSSLRAVMPPEPRQALLLCAPALTLWSGCCVIRLLHRRGRQAAARWKGCCRCINAAGQDKPEELVVAEQSQKQTRGPLPLSMRPGASLPIAEQLEEIKSAVEQQRVVIIVGGTGCGKSTQVPQYILDEAAAQGHKANVLVTQPRRMAAVTLARRVAQERGEEVGKDIGYRMRGEVVPGEQLTFVTAGYLLSWFTVEPEAFATVTHIILDEAHVRDAQMELLILLVRMLMRIYLGPRLVLMSATIESSFFAEYFKEFAVPRHVSLTPIFVGGRQFPVDVTFLDDLAAGEGPRGYKLDKDQKNQARDCITEVFEGGGGFGGHGGEVRARVWKSIETLALDILPNVAEAGSTILVFVPGYGDLCRMHSKLYWNLPIEGSVNFGTVPPKPEELDDLDELDEDMDDFVKPGGAGPTAMAVDKPVPASILAQEGEENSGRPHHYRVFALHSQVPSEDQELVLQPPDPGVCHIVLATTIAESSLTLPEVCGVIDFGVHRTVYGDPNRPGLIQLTTQWCARSQLTQREGRAGRTRPGWCIKLVPRKFFDRSMPEYETPEILRTPLSKLFLQAKGISDGLTKAVQDDDNAMRRLALKVASPGALLMQLPSPPQKEAIDAAVHELVELGVLTAYSENADITVLGRIALWLPLDVRLCRLVWLGALWGCPAEAVVLAAACSTPNPFQAPSRLAFGDVDEFTENLLQSAESRRYFDAGHFSEPLMCLRVFHSWARRLSLTSSRAVHSKRWFGATASLMEDAAIDPQKMSVFVGFIADVAMRARDMCSDARENDKTLCSVRDDLHLLIKLLRRPDLTFAEQRERTGEHPPKLGDVFRASASTLYALLAAAFSDNLLIGKHKFAAAKKTLEPMLDALEELQDSGIASQDAILLPMVAKRLHRGKLSTEEAAKQMVASICGEEPQEVAITDNFVAISFAKKHDGPREAPVWLRDSESSKLGDSINYGLGGAVTTRMVDMAVRPRLCFMASGGLRKFTIDDAEFVRAISPYELQFNLVHSSFNAKQTLTAIFSEQNPLGFACHITSPEVPLGRDHFACVASTLMLTEAQTAVRCNDATLLSAEQLIYALTTLCPSSLKLALGFKRGLGGNADGTHAALAGIRLQRHGRAVPFTRNLAGVKTVEQVNLVRKNMLEALVKGVASRTSKGQEVLLWEDAEAKSSLLALVDLVEGAEEASVADFQDEGDLAEHFVWVSHNSKGGESTGKDRKLVGGSARMQILQPISISATVEKQVARVMGQNAGILTHKFECPDCGERFRKWESCHEHYNETCHVDVSTEEAVKEAKAASRPVRYRCPQCYAGFFDWASCSAHLSQLNHLDWAEESVARLLCVPPAVEGLDEEDEEEDEQEKERKKAKEKEHEERVLQLQGSLSQDPRVLEAITRWELDATSARMLRQLETEQALAVVRKVDKSVRNPSAFVSSQINDFLQDPKTLRGRNNPPLPEAPSAASSKSRDLDGGGKPKRARPSSSPPDSAPVLFGGKPTTTGQNVKLNSDGKKKYQPPPLPAPPVRVRRPQEEAGEKVAPINAWTVESP